MNMSEEDLQHRLQDQAPPLNQDSVPTVGALIERAVQSRRRKRAATNPLKAPSKKYIYIYIFFAVKGSLGIGTVAFWPKKVC